MKLKLETQDQITVLVVTDTIELAHIPVLKAGITKLFQSGKKTLLLDLTAVPEAQLKVEALRAQLAELRTWALTQDADVVVVSSVAGNAKSRGEGVALLTSPLAKQQALETKLRVQIQQLETQKTKLTQALSLLGADADLKKVRIRNSQLKKDILAMEKVAKKFFTRRNTKKARASEPLESGLQNLTTLLDDFLKKEGVLP